MILKNDNLIWKTRVLFLVYYILNNEKTSYNRNGWSEVDVNPNKTDLFEGSFFWGGGLIDLTSSFLGLNH